MGMILVQDFTIWSLLIVCWGNVVLSIYLANNSPLLAFAFPQAEEKISEIIFFLPRTTTYFCKIWGSQNCDSCFFRPALSLQSYHESCWLRAYRSVVFVDLIRQMFTVDWLVKVLSSRLRSLNSFIFKSHNFLS